MNRMLLDYSPELDIFDGETFARRGAPTASESEEAQEMELATRVLEATDAAELERVIAVMIRRGRAAVRKPLASAVATQLAALLKPVARRLVPGLGAARGAARAVTGTDGPARMGHFFGLELEGLSPEDQEFESARAFVRFAMDAARHATVRGLPPAAAGRAAMAAAACRHAPGWLRLSHAGDCGVRSLPPRRATPSPR